MLSVTIPCDEQSQQSANWAPFPTPFSCDPSFSFTPTYKAFHYQLGPFTPLR